MAQYRGYILSSLIQLFLFLFAFFPATKMASAQGNLQIMPKRVVFEGGKRFQELNLANTGQDSAQYVISLVNYKMKENGEFQEVNTPEPGQNFADKYLRIFPRSVTLAPNEAQSVKIQTIRTADLPAGEYRSYLYFRAIPSKKPLGEQDNKTDTAKGISIKLIPIFGISIPAIIRIGESNVKVSLSDLSLDDSNNAPQLKLTFNRAGNISAYGTLSVKYIALDGTESQVGIAKGLAIYTPNLKRHFILPLERNKDIDYKKGKLQVSFAASEDDKQAVLAEATLALK